MANFYAVRLIAALHWLRHRVWISDPATCYKLVRTDVLRELKLTSRGFELCQEITSKLLLRSADSIIEIPIRYQPRTRAAGKKIRWYDLFPSVSCVVRAVR